MQFYALNQYTGVVWKHLKYQGIDTPGDLFRICGINPLHLYIEPLSEPCTYYYLRCKNRIIDFLIKIRRFVCLKNPKTYTGSWLDKKPVFEQVYLVPYLDFRPHFKARKAGLGNL